jgi:hypothetical protein
MSHLQRQCERRIAGLPIPQPFDLDAFAAIVADYRGQPVQIRLVPGLACLDGLSGAWCPTNDADLILIDDGASVWHKGVIGCHELAHLLCDHPGNADALKAAVRELMPDLGDNAFRRMLGRHARYSREEELEAEMTACLILERADADPLSSWGTGPEGTAGRLAHALRHPVRRW